MLCAIKFLSDGLNLLEHWNGLWFFFFLCISVCSLYVIHAYSLNFQIVWFQWWEIKDG